MKCGSKVAMLAVNESKAWVGLTEAEDFIVSDLSAKILVITYRTHAPLDFPKVLTEQMP